MEPAPAKRCPICKKQAVEKFTPFCSARCADVDLNRWLTGGYVIPASADPEPEDGEGNDLSLPYDEDDNI